MACLISQADFLQCHTNQFRDDVRPYLDFERNILSQSCCLALADGQKSVMELSFFVSKNLSKLARFKGSLVCFCVGLGDFAV